MGPGIWLLSGDSRPCEVLPPCTGQKYSTPPLTGRSFVQHRLQRIYKSSMMEDRLIAQAKVSPTLAAWRRNVLVSA